MQIRFWSFLILIASITFSCDQCKDVNCLNSGTCVDGDCECLDGFSGTTCELEDKCVTGNVSCENGGLCQDGACACEDGYSGDSCEDEDKCITKDIDCENGGDCDDGSCECLPGYFGDRCQYFQTAVSRDDFLGDFDVDEDCTTGTYAYSSSVTAGSGSNEIGISNFYEVFSNNVIATVDGYDITIAYQEPDTAGVFVSGSGSMNEDMDEITLEYTVSNSTTSDDCSGVWTRN